MIGALAIDEGAAVLCVRVLLHNRGNAFFWFFFYRVCYGHRQAIAAKSICCGTRVVQYDESCWCPNLPLPFAVAVGIPSDWKNNTYLTTEPDRRYRYILYSILSIYAIIVIKFFLIFLMF